MGLFHSVCMILKSRCELLQFDYFSTIFLSWTYPTRTDFYTNWSWKSLMYDKTGSRLLLWFVVEYVSEKFNYTMKRVNFPSKGDSFIFLFFYVFFFFFFENVFEYILYFVWLANSLLMDVLLLSKDVIGCFWVLAVLSLLCIGHIFFERDLRMILKKLHFK